MKRANTECTQRLTLSGVFSWILGGILIRPLRTFGASIVIVAGPWLLSVVTLAIIGFGVEPVLGRAAVEDLRLTIIYALCVAPLIAGPIGALAARLIRRSVEEDDGRLVSEIFLTATISAGVITLASAASVSALLGISNIGIAMAFVFLSVATALLWTSLSALAALRLNTFLIVAFACGMVVAILTAFAAARSNLTVEMLIWCFTSGITFCVALALARIVEGRDSTSKGLVEAANEMKHEFIRHRFLALGILFAFCGVWVDKWVLWAGPNGVRSASGFLHFGTYDSVMFVAHLSIIPAFAAMHLLHDGEISRAIREFRDALNRRANFAMLRSSVEALSARVWSGVFAIVFVQATISATLVLIAPIVSDLMRFDFSQFLMLRVGLVAVFVHSIFYLSSAVLVVCGCHRLFAFVQFSFFTANFFFSTVFLTTIGPSVYGLFASSLIAALLSFLLAFRSLYRYDYLMLVGENDALYGERS